MEGLTDSIFRRLHHQFFPGLDGYFTPFLSPTSSQLLTAREMRELPVAESLAFSVVPQILTKKAEHFLWMAQKCADLGYPEVNLNLGCPSGTVTAKGKGSGMLRDTDALSHFLDDIFKYSKTDISIKTRIGFDNASEFPKILEIYNRYPIKELTIHPRVRSAFYSGSVDMQSFSYAIDNAKIPLCYNGDLTSLEQIDSLQKAYPQLQAVMIGRGLIRNPGMFASEPATAERLQAFYDALLDDYISAFGSSRNALFRLKEHWGMLIGRFENAQDYAKQLRKTSDISQYKAITSAIFRECPLK